MFVSDPETSTENINGASLPGFLASGTYDVVEGASIRYNAGRFGTYWSSTIEDANQAYRMDLSVYSADHPDSGPGYYYANPVSKTGSGRSARCILREP